MPKTLPKAGATSDPASAPVFLPTRVKTDLVLVDPNTSLDYVKAFREESGFTVIEVPSSIEKIPGAQTYSALFENMIRALLKGAQEKAG